LRGFIFTGVLLKIPFKLASWKNALLFVTVTEDEWTTVFPILITMRRLSTYF